MLADNPTLTTRIGELVRRAADKFDGCQPPDDWYRVDLSDGDCDAIAASAVRIMDEIAETELAPDSPIALRDLPYDDGYTGVIGMALLGFIGEPAVSDDFVQWVIEELHDAGIFPDREPEPDCEDEGDFDYSWYYRKERSPYDDMVDPYEMMGVGDLMDDAPHSSEAREALRRYHGIILDSFWD